MSDQAVRFPAPGEKERRTLSFTSALLAGEERHYLAISGSSDGPTVCLTAGIHGAEYPPIDALLRFGQSINPRTLSGRLLIMPVVNLAAFSERTPFLCPRDGKNLNRLFPGQPSGSYSDVLAHEIFEKVMCRGDYLIDLHAGDMVEELMPFSLIQQTSNAQLDSTAQDLAVAFGLPYLVLQAPSGGPIAGTTAAAAAAAGIPAVIAEAGGVGQLQAEAVKLHLRGLVRALNRLGLTQGPLTPLPDPVLMSEFVWPRAEKGGFFRKAVSAGDRVQAGTVLGEMVDLWGESQGTVVSPADGVILFVTTSPAIADGGLIAGIGVPR